MGEEEESATGSATTLAELRRQRRFRHNADQGESNGQAKDELKTPDEVAKARKIKDQTKKRFQRKLDKQKGKRGPNHHPAKTRRMENKRSTNTRVKVLVR